MVQIDKDQLEGDILRLSMDAVGAIMNGENERAKYYTNLLGWLYMLRDFIRAEEQNER
jgi:hypothetical protein